MSKITSTILVLLVLMQGGFYPNAYLVIGTCVSFLLLIRGKMVVNKAIFFSIAGILVLYLLSCIVHGFSVLQYLPVFQILSCLLFYILISSFDEKERGHLTIGIAIGGIIVACLGLLCFTADIPIPAAVSNGRLQSTLQYADATAILFVLALMAMNGTKGKVYNFRPLILLALFLTLSYGGMLAYCLAAVLYVFRQKRGERIRCLLKEIADFSIVGLFAAAIFYFHNFLQSGPVSVLFLAGLCCLCPVWGRMIQFILGHLTLRIVSVVLLCAEGAGILFYRGVEAAGAFANRITLISYGMNALAANPVLGIGPGAWATQRSLYEPVYDRANIIHSSYMQIAVDAGVFALILIAILSVFMLLRLNKSKNQWRFPAVAGLVLHGIIDLSFSFTGIVFCGIAAAAGEEEKRKILPAWFVRLIAIGALAAFIYIDILYFSMLQ